MKSRMTLILVALSVIMGTLVFMLQDRKTAVDAPQMSAPQISAPAPAPVIEVQAAPLQSAVAPTTAPAPAIASDAPKSAPMVRVETDGKLKYTARAGDTISELATALLGSNSKANRDAIIAANPSLQSDPDRVLAGSTYSIASNAVPSTDDKTVATDDKTPVAAETKPSDATAAVAETAPAKTSTESKPLADANGPLLKYTAQTGDTVGVLAANLLGGDTQANRDLIVAANPSLQANPDHLVAGQTYTIVAANGLSTNGYTAPIAKPSAQPDADEMAKLSVGRTLRYVAQPGDTVTKLTTTLLGSDTPANRSLILDANPSLKRDPDHLIAGKTYWISAPTADSVP